MLRKSTVYLILNKNTGVVYVGGTTFFKKRINNHFVCLRNGNHENANLQDAYSKDGKDSFLVIILEECSKKELKDREQVWMDRFEDKYNIVPNARGGRKLGPLTEEWKRNIGLAARGNKGNRDSPRTEQWRRRLSEASKKYWAKVRETNRE